jgi:hypothetical protein
MCFMIIKGIDKNIGSPKSELSKKHNSINYDPIYEAVAPEILHVFKEEHLYKRFGSCNTI